jgi:hypothetical protein
MQLWRQTHVALIEIIEKDERAKAGGRTLFLENPRFSTGQKSLGERTGDKGAAVIVPRSNGLADLLPHSRDRRF